MPEKLDVYNKEKIKTGKIIERKDGITLPEGEYINSVTCWIVNKEGKILLTQRRLDKSHGGMWEPTGGLLQSGETILQGIKRELYEEIGVNIENHEIKLIKEKAEETQDINFFRNIYLIKDDIKINELKFNDGEVINAKYVTQNEFNDMISKNEAHEWLHYFNDIYKEIKF